MITSITSQKRNKERVNIFVDGEYALSLSRILAVGLQIGQTLDDAAILRLTSADEVEDKIYLEIGAIDVKAEVVDLTASAPLDQHAALAR